MIRLTIAKIPADTIRAIGLVIAAITKEMIGTAGAIGFFNGDLNPVVDGTFSFSCRNNSIVSLGLVRLAELETTFQQR